MNTHTALHAKAEGLAKQYLSHEKELITVLMEMDEKKSFRELGYTGLFNYCLGELHFSESQAAYFSKVAKKSQEVPALKQAIDTGKLTRSSTGQSEPPHCQILTQQPSRQMRQVSAQVPSNDDGGDGPYF